MFNNKIKYGLKKIIPTLLFKYKIFFLLNKQTKKN